MCCSVVFSQLKSLEFCSGFSVSTKVLPLTISYDGPQEDLKNNDGSHNDNDKKKKMKKKKNRRRRTTTIIISILGVFKFHYTLNFNNALRNRTTEVWRLHGHRLREVRCAGGCSAGGPDALWKSTAGWQYHGRLRQAGSVLNIAQQPDTKRAEKKHCGWLRNPENQLMV